MAFKNDQVTQLATIMNQHIKLTINFSSEVVQLFKIAKLNCNNFFAQMIWNYNCKQLSRGLYEK